MPYPPLFFVLLTTHITIMVISRIHYQFAGMRLDNKAAHDMEPVSANLQHLVGINT